MPLDKKQNCLDDLKKRVLSMQLRPGENLEEAALCDAYDMSRTPLREVLQRLKGEGYLTLSENKGAKVSSLDIATLRTFFQTAPLVYSTISRLAAENRTSEQLDRLKDIQHDFAKAASKEASGEAAMLNHQLHAQIGKMAGNVYMVASLNRMLIDHTRLSQTFYRPASPAESLLVKKASEQHDAMISAFEAQEPALAVDLTLQHWDLSRDRMERFVQPDPLPLDVVSLKDKRHAI